MKEIFEGIWNAPKEQVGEALYNIMMLYCIGVGLALIFALCLFKYLSKKWGFGKEFDDKFKDMDKFKHF